MSFLCTICGLLGVFTVGYVFYHFLILIRQFIRPSKNLNDYGKWSIVTGSTDGIGKAISFQLAKKGQNILLIGRSVEKLNTVKDEIKNIYPQREIETLQIDLSEFNESSEKSFCDAIANKDVGILVNGAGLSYDFTTYFDEVDEKRIQEIMKVNSTVPTLLMYHVIKNKFLKKNKPKKGIVINISSAGGVMPHELHSVYAASKAYLNKISLDLALEYEAKGIEIQVQLPFFVVTNMSKRKYPTFSIPSAEDYAKHAVAQFGYSGLIFPYPVHAVMYFIMKFLPDFVLAKYMGDLFHSVRRRAMAKLSKKKD